MSTSVVIIVALVVAVLLISFLSRRKESHQVKSND
jgi:hypothetical protein